MRVDEIDTPLENSIFDSKDWLELFSNYKIYGVFRGDELVGSMSGFEEGGYFSGNYPFTYAQGIVCEKKDELPVGKTLASFLKTKYERITIVNYSFEDIRPFLWEGFKPLVRFTYFVSEPNLDKDTRYEVRKSERNGNVIRRGSLREFYDMYVITFKRKGLDVPCDWEFFKKFDLFNPDVYMSEEAGAVFLKDDKRAYYMFGASTGSAKHLVYNALLNYKETDMVGCNLEEIGLYKRGFGGRLKPCLGVTNV